MDPTLHRCDDEPWNQRPDPPPVSPSPILSLHERIRRRIPIFAADGGPARWVYCCHSGPSHAPDECLDCGALARTFSWCEYEYKPNHTVTVPGWNPVQYVYNGPPEVIVRDYRVVERTIDLCAACSRALEALPLGTRWKRSRERMAVLGRCIRALEAVGDAEAVRVLQSLQEQRRCS